MPGQHRPGYQARRKRIERYVLNHFKAARPDEYAAAWADGETQENQRKANVGRPGGEAGPPVT